MADVSRTVELDRVARLQYGRDYAGMFPGERGDDEEGRAGLHPTKGIEHPGSPDGIGSIIESQSRRRRRDERRARTRRTR